MTWSKAFQLKVRVYQEPLTELNQTALVSQYKQHFSGPYRHLTHDRMAFLLAMKLAADSFRDHKRTDTPGNALALLALHKERR